MDTNSSTQEFLSKKAKIKQLLQERNLDEAEELCLTTMKQAEPKERLLLEDLLAGIYRAAHRLPEALTHCQAALELAEKLYPANDLLVANVLHNLSMTLDLDQKYAEAIPYAQRELEILKSIYPDSDKRIAYALLSLAKHHYELGRFDLAKEMLQDCQNRFSQIEGPRGLGVSACLNNFGRILENQGATAEAIPLYQEAVSIRRELLGQHEDTAFTLLNLGTALADLGLFKEAAEVLRECRDMYLDLGLEDSPYLEAARSNLLLCFNKVCTPC